MNSFPVLMKQIIQNYKTGELEIVSGFPNKKDKKEAINYVIENNLGKYINFRGLISKDEKYSVLKNGNILILPAYYPFEGQPISILEGLAFGMPIITTRYRAIPSMVEEGRNGVFLSMKSPKEIAEAIMRFYKNPHLILEMDKESYRIVKEDFAEKKYIERFIYVFKNL